MNTTAELIYEDMEEPVTIENVDEEILDTEDIYPCNNSLSKTLNKKMLKVVVFSHSNIAVRQQKFWKVFSKYADVKVISPKVWGKLKSENEIKGSYELIAADTENTGDMYSFTFDSAVYKMLEEWNPDIIYNQNEATAFSSIKTCKWANEKGYTYINFVWENLESRAPKNTNYILNNSDAIIAGNDKAKQLHNADYIMPQVGIDTDFFKPRKEKKLFGAVFIGREVPEKGIEYIKQAHPPIHIFSNLSYDEVPKIMNKSKVIINYPYDTENWVEQFIPFSTLEAMSSGLPIITSDAGSIPFWLKESPVFFVPQKNKDLLKLAIERILKDEELRDVMSEGGRIFALKFDNHIIAKQLIDIFKEVKNGRR